MRLFAHRVDPFDNGMYVIADDRGDAILIDPSRGEREAMATIRDHELTLVEILNTHGHQDHVFDNARVKEETRARLAIHSADAYRLDPATRPTAMLEPPKSVADDLIAEGPLAYLRDVKIQALHTPGHTEGSVCFYLPTNALLFSGDVLFAGNVGRIDLPGGDARQMESSLARVATLPPETRVFPGHGPATTVGDELRWLKGFRFS
ncbi:MAG TPA: MBL fold metallo-hydrolase [Chloroflexi bacterium]|jgi:glyoxylase-like metal-dependent hydrolase (beta-lactamase superfamily II)|nr:MBL fold metallo-hydrolase [Chloroflexota bacterium]HAL27080.1 MBL fold metallo-hydrolase [Chloroflexota bacterium]